MTSAARMPDRNAGTRGQRRGQLLVKGMIALVVLGAGGLGVAALTGQEKGDGGHARSTSDVVPVSRIDFDITTSATGELEARNQIEISSKLETRSTILEIVKEGTRVKKGDVLIRLNSEEIDREIVSQELAVIEARRAEASATSDVQIQHSLNDSELRKARLKLELAELALKQWEEGELEKKRTQLRLAIEQAQRQHERLTEKFRNAEELLKQGFLSKDERDRDEIELINAESNLLTARLDQEIYETYEYPREKAQKTSDVTEAIAELARVTEHNKIQLDEKAGTLETRRKQLQNREDRMAELRQQKASCTLIAPTDGLVVYATNNDDFFMRGGDAGPLVVGREVRPNEPLIRLPDTSEIIAKVRIHERLAGQVRTGQFARVKVEALGGAEFEGEVDSVGILAEQVWRDNRKEYTVRIALRRGEQMDRLKPTGGCEAEIRIATVEDALAVPLQAVFSDGPVRFVYSPRGGKFVRVPIKQGKHSKSYIEVAAGLKEGQSVLIREPGPAEVVSGPWDPGALKLVGLEVNDKGEPVAAPGAWGGQAGRGRGRPADGGGPAGREGPPQANNAAPSVEAAAKAGDQPGESQANKPGDRDGEPDNSAAESVPAVAPVAGDASVTVAPGVAAGGG